MNGDNPTGPLMLGQWQKPAALINAGLVPPDPYPVEKLLFCAGCGQQFFGTHLTGTRSTDSTHAAGGAHEASDINVMDSAHLTDGVHLTDGIHLTDGTRVYRAFCNCRPGPLPAGEVELQVYTETHIHAFDTDPVTGLTTAHYALLAARFFTRVELGHTPDHITFTNRI